MYCHQSWTNDTNDIGLELRYKNKKPGIGVKWLVSFQCGMKQQQITVDTGYDAA